MMARWWSGLGAAAVDGRATAAALAAVAAAFGVRPHAVTLVAGPVSRTSILDVDGEQPGCPRPAARAMTFAGTTAAALSAAGAATSAGIHL